MDPITVILLLLGLGAGGGIGFYVRNQQKSAEAAGVGFEARNYPESISLEQLQGVLAGLNADPRVNGIIIQRPLPVLTSTTPRLANDAR